ncbi:MAG: hypothetical protein JWQ73_4238 [Variovorax sp.]|nr:hypothetical protein [Variovorax sp.]
MAFGVTVTALASVLVVAALQTPNEESGLLSAAILCALPWSLILLTLDQAPGFAERAGFFVVGGVCLNVALLWFVWLGIAAYRRRHQRESKGVGA